MRTIHEYEASDIDLKAEDPVIRFLLAEVLLIAVRLAAPPAGDSQDDRELWLRQIIADCLNHAQKAGITITKSAEVT